MDKKEIIEKIRENRKDINNEYTFYIDTDRIDAFLDNVRLLFYPEYFTDREIDEDALMEKIIDDLHSQIDKVMKEADEITDEFIQRLPKIQSMLNKDIEAIYNGDPSCKTYEEIVLSFPGFIAAFDYRIAHELYDLNVPIIPRIIAEKAHEKTGIDINPGARIGEYFCIDHGTGIVIGETATVGNNVRMYHGVTLGVRSFRKDEEGNLLKGGKRHPDVGNHVILYANATILGGDTAIENGSVVPTGSLVLQTPEKFK